MHNLNNITKILGTTALLVVSSAALAETVTIQTTTSVDNTIDFQTDGASLDFGTVRATQDDTVNTCVGITVPANPVSTSTAVLGSDAGALCSAGAGNDVLQNVGGIITRPGFTIAGLAAFTTLTLNLPASGTALALTPAPTGAPGFTLQDFTAHQTSGTAGAVTTSIAADAAGGVAFSVGATLVSDGTTAALAYQNVTYDGSFVVEVTF